MQALNCPLRVRRWGCVSQQSQRPVGPLLLGVSAPLGVQRQLLIVQAARGFGKTKPKKDDAVDGVSGSRRKTKSVKVEQGSIGPIPGQAQQQVATTFNDQLLVPKQPTEEDDDFAKRLALLKEQGRERAAELKAASPAEGTSAQAASSPAIFDVQEDIYANPPPITQTLMGAAGESSISDPKLRDANIGPSQLGLAAGAIVFVAIFIIVAAGDYAPASKRYSGVRPAQQPPDAIEEKILKGKVALYEDQLKVRRGRTWASSKPALGIKLPQGATALHVFHSVAVLGNVGPGLRLAQRSWGHHAPAGLGAGTQTTPSDGLSQHQIARPCPPCPCCCNGLGCTAVWWHPGSGPCRCRQRLTSPAHKGPSPPSPPSPRLTPPTRTPRRRWPPPTPACCSTTRRRSCSRSSRPGTAPAHRQCTSLRHRHGLSGCGRGSGCKDCSGDASIWQGRQRVGRKPAGGVTGRADSRTKARSSSRGSGMRPMGQG